MNAEEVLFWVCVALCIGGLIYLGVEGFGPWVEDAPEEDDKSF